jgi:hypothetical protein
MKPTLLTLFFACFLAPLFSQHDFSKVDSFAFQFKQPYAAAADLSKKLTAIFDSDLDKARALFIWVANNIRYDCQKFHNPEPTQLSWRTEEERVKKQAAAQQAKVKATLKSKKGVCEDYSQLYKALCDAAGVECLVITGDARDFYRPYKNNQRNPHAWNAIKIEGEWRLLDVTWAAGHVNPEVTKFTRSLKPGWFMTPPKWFAQSHLPDDEQWQLMSPAIPKKAFPDQALVNFAQQDYPLEDFSTDLEWLSDGQVNLRFKFKNVPPAVQLATGKSRPIEFDQRSENGYTVLTFSPPAGREVILFAGKALNRPMEWMARYEIKRDDK